MTADSMQICVVDRSGETVKECQGSVLKAEALSIEFPGCEVVIYAENIERPGMPGFQATFVSGERAGS